MGRCNNRRTREAAAALQNTPSRARFSKGPPKRTNKRPTSSHEQATKQAVVNKIVERFEAPVTRTKVASTATTNQRAASSSSALPTLDERVIRNLDEITLSDESVQLIEEQLRELGVIESEPGDSGRLSVVVEDADDIDEPDEADNGPQSNIDDTVENQPNQTQRTQTASGGYTEYEDDYDFPEYQASAVPLTNDPDWEGVQELMIESDNSIDDAFRNDPVYINLTQQLSFADTDAARACRALETWGGGASASSTAADASHRHRLSLALDWLSLHLTEFELRVGFQKKQRPELAIQAARIKAVPHPSIAVATKLTEDADFLMSAQLDERAVGFVQLGFAYEDVIEVLKASAILGEKREEADALDDSVTLRALLGKLERRMVADEGNFAQRDNDISQANDDVAFDEREMEKLALKGIYDAGFVVLENDAGNERYRIMLDDGVLHVFLRRSYPVLQSPLFLFNEANSTPPLLRQINTALIAQSQLLIGTPSIFEITIFIGENLLQIKDEFKRDLRTQQFKEQQDEMRRLVDRKLILSVEDIAGDNPAVGRRQIARRKASEKAYDYQENASQQFQKQQITRLQRVRDADANIRSIMAEKAIQKREECRRKEEIEQLSRSAMSASLNRGESVEDARLAATEAERNYRIEHGLDVDENDGDDSTPKSKAECKCLAEQIGAKVHRPSATTQAFMDRLRNMYADAKDSKLFRLDRDDDAKVPSGCPEDAHLPRPVAYPVGDLREIMEDVSATQKGQPWLVATGARVPHLETNSQNEAFSSVVGDRCDERDRINNQLRKELNRVAASKDVAFQKILAQRKSLPAYQVRDKIVSVISASQVTVIAGETGSGKTTQAAQLVLDDMIQQGVGSSANMIVTQPRRISAISVAERISSERNEKVGQTCGYSIKLEKKVSGKTRLLLCTTGILLRRLQLDPDLASVSHVFLDEIHERELNTDFLLIIMKGLLQRRKGLKLILMSATLDADKFAGYFDDCAVVTIPGRTHPVQELRLEDVLQLTGYEYREDSEYALKTKPGKSTPMRWSKGSLKKRYYPKFASHVIHSLSIANESLINYELIAVLTEHISISTEQGAILIFLPGMAEITKAIEELCKKEFFQDPGRSLIVPLHSTLSSAEQSAVFKVPPKGVRKIVLSTNLAETSITVEDVVFVIDTGRVKESQRDEVKETPTLIETWVSRAGAKQRRGRAGRVRPGISYHLFSSHTHDEVLQSYQLPEMLRVGLEDVTLQIMALDLGEPHQFLSKALDPPSALAAYNALRMLEQLGAVECKWGPTVGQSSEKVRDCGGLQVSSGLTALGFHLASLPFEPRVGKMLLYGAMFGCVGPALNFAAVMTSTKSMFTSSFADRDDAEEARRSLAVENSDLLTASTVFDFWNGLTGGTAHKYVRDNYLSRGTLLQMQELRQQYARFLVDSGFLPTGFRLTKNLHNGANANATNISLLKAVLCAGLYPNVMVAPRTLVNGVSAQSAGEMAFQSHKKGEIYLHPSTILFTTRRLNSRYGCFHEIIKTSKLYVRDCTLISPVALILFGGGIEIYHGQDVITVDEWLRFKLPVRHAALLKHLRLHMEKALLQKILKPAEEAFESATVRTLINSVSLLLGNEMVPASPDDGREIVRPWQGRSEDRGRGNGSGRYGNRGGRGRGRGRIGGRGFGA